MSNKRATTKLIPWDEMINILNRLQSSHPGHMMEYVNKWVNDEIYEYFQNKAYEDEVEAEGGDVHVSEGPYEVGTDSVFFWSNYQ